MPWGPIILCPRCGGTDWRGETNAEAIKRLRAEAFANGKCYTCRLRPVKPGARYCQVCIDRAASYTDSIAYVKCQNCGADVRQRKRLLCERCSKKHVGYRRQVSAQRVANNLCGRCGDRPLHPGSARGRAHTMCGVCLDECKDRQLALGRRRGSKPRNVCSICTQQGLVGVDHNRTTHDRWLARQSSSEPTLSLACGGTKY